MKKLLLILSLVAFAACSPDKDENSIIVKKSNYTMNYCDEAQIEAVSEFDIAYASENEYIAQVSSQGIITAGKVGKTSIILDNGKESTKIYVQVKPRLDIFPEPISKASLGITKAELKRKFGKPDFENETSLYYRSYHKNYDYMFIIQDDKVMDMTVVVPQLELSAIIVDFLTERYQPTTILPEYDYAFLNENKDIAITIKAYYIIKELFISYSSFFSETTPLDDSAILEHLLEARNKTAL